MFNDDESRPTVKIVELGEAARILLDAVVEARREALEEAANVCEAEAKNYPIHDDIARGCDYCAEAIRALMEPKPQGGSFP